MSCRPTPKNRESFAARKRRARKLGSSGVLPSDAAAGDEGESGGETGAGGEVGAEMEPRP